MAGLQDGCGLGGDLLVGCGELVSDEQEEGVWFPRRWWTAP
ncbi:hypothetical protein [Streptomyces sp. GbtcB6]|nr:hypothetical protein [Streptomyces sp. GbtcB6]